MPNARAVAEYESSGTVSLSSMLSDFPARLSISANCSSVRWGWASSVGCDDFLAITRCLIRLAVRHGATRRRSINSEPQNNNTLTVGKVESPRRYYDFGGNAARIPPIGPSRLALA